MKLRATILLSLATVFSGGFQNTVFAKIGERADFSMNCVLALEVVLKDLKVHFPRDGYHESMLQMHRSVSCFEDEGKVGIMVNSPSEDHFGGAVLYWVSQGDFHIMEKREVR